MGKPWVHFACLAMLLAAAGALQAADSLRDRMSERTFRAAGLHKLTSEELAVLAEWMADPQSVDVPDPEPPPQTSPVAPAPPAPERRAAAGEREFGAEQIPRPAPVETGPEEIRARIDGPFDGWRGKTVFKLDNGQVWRQRVSGRYRYRAESPEVLITRGRFGYYLKLLDTSRVIGVKRIK